MPQADLPLSLPVLIAIEIAVFAIAEGARFKAYVDSDVSAVLCSTVHWLPASCVLERVCSKSMRVLLINCGAHAWMQMIVVAGGPQKTRKWDRPFGLEALAD